MITELGDTYIAGWSALSWGRCATISINEYNFSAEFDHHKKVWMASKKLTNSQTPVEVKNWVLKYAVSDWA